MADEQTIVPTPAPATAPEEAPKGQFLEDGVRAVFGDEAADAISGKAPATPPAKAGEKRPVEDKPVHDEKVSKRILAAQRAEQKAAQQRRESDQLRSDIAKERAALEEDKKLAAEAKAAKASPSKLLELSGLKPKEFLEALATEHEPDKVAERVANGVKTEVDKLREQLAKVEKERAEEKHALERARHEHATRETEKAFVSMVEEAPEAYPRMQSLTERQITRLTYEALNEVIGRDGDGKPVTRNEAFFAEHDRFPTDEEIAGHIEERLTADADETLAARRARQGNAATKPRQGMVTTGETREAPTDSRGQVPRTLTARAASRAVPQKSLNDLTDEERDELSLQIWRGKASLTG